MTRWRRAAVAVIWCTAGCATTATGATVPALESSTETRPAAHGVATLRVVAENERTHRVGDLVQGHSWTVLFFFSATCPTVTAHDQRLKALWRDFHAQGVGVYAIASESDMTLSALRREAAARGYPFPLLLDPEGRLARELGVRYASQAFVLGRDAEVAYAGSLDSDRRFLHDDAEPYLANALTALQHGRTPNRADAAAYGCALSLPNVPSGAPDRALAK